MDFREKWTRLHFFTRNMADQINDVNANNLQIKLKELHLYVSTGLSWPIKQVRTGAPVTGSL